MPARTEPVTIIATNAPELKHIGVALAFSSGTRPDKDARKRSQRLLERLGMFFPDVRDDDGQKRTRIELFPSEYETILEALEYFVAKRRGDPDWEFIFNLWERLLFEGSHASGEELQELRRRYGR